METSNPINVQLDAKARLKARIHTLRAMLEAGLADLTAAAYAEECFLDDHIDDLGDRPNRVADGISAACTLSLGRLGDALAVVNEWAPATPGRREARMGE
jgi:hypothetical protein